jgi:hypothetical protein
MSRGLGRIEKVVLSGLALREWLHGATLVDFVAAHLGRQNTPAIEASVRRALKTLKRKRLIVQNEHKQWMGADDAQERKRRDDRERARRENEARQEAREEQERKEWRKSRYRFANGFAGAAPKGAPVANTAKLAKLLGILGSGHDGEVLAAARKVEAERMRLGQSWEELLRVQRASA